MGSNMKKIIVVFFTSLFFSLSFLFSQESVSVKWPNNQVGFTASMFTGYGLVYGYHWSDDFMTKVNIYGFGEMNNLPPNPQALLTTIGLEFQYNIMRSRYSRFSVFAAVSHWYDESSEYPYDYNNSPPTYFNIENIKRTTQVGLGFALELLAWNRLGFSFEGGYLARFSSNSGFNNTYIQNRTVYSYYENFPIWMGFGVGASITYGF